jgi:hypothetical protein
MAARHTPPEQTCLFLFDFDTGRFESAILP